MRVSAVVPAAGLGLRLKTNIAKPLALINGEAIIIHTLRRLSSHPLIGDIIVVFNSRDMEELRKLIHKNGIKKIKDIVEGGPTRQHSVKNGLSYLGNADLVLIHDGVRPFIEHKIITDVINDADKFDAAAVGMPVKATLKKKKTGDVLEIDSTLKRDEIWEIQTPQVFRKDLIVRAYENSNGMEATDDAFLVERLGHRVRLVTGSSFNIKITTPDDLALAQAIDNLIKSLI